VDIICGGFPCQAFSIAGARRGFEDTRGTLFFEIARFASILRPRYLFLENVKGLLNHENNHLSDGYRIRKLTPRECWRLQGFPDWAFDKAQEVNSNSQLYKQAGNSVTVNVIAAMAKELQ
jgi:site-specific DNA-cytosine methylase